MTSVRGTFGQPSVDAHKTMQINELRISVVKKGGLYEVCKSSITLAESVIRQRYEELIHEVGAEIRGSEASRGRRRRESCVSDQSGIRYWSGHRPGFGPRWGGCGGCRY